MTNYNVVDSYKNVGTYGIGMAGKRYVFANERGDYLEIIVLGERGEEIRFVLDNFPSQRKVFNTNIPYASLEEFEVDLKRMGIDIPKRLDVVSESDLEAVGLVVEHFDYGIYQLKQDGEVILEAEELSCKNRAIEILKKLRNESNNKTG